MWIAGLMTFLGSFFTLPILRVILVAIGLAGISFIELRVYDKGYNAAEVKYQTQIEQIKNASALELARQKQANDVAQAITAQDTKTLTDTIYNLNQELIDETVLAAKDTNANRPSLDASSVRRLNGLGSTGDQTSSDTSAPSPQVLPTHKSPGKGTHSTGG